MGRGTLNLYRRSGWTNSSPRALSQWSGQEGRTCETRGRRSPARQKTGGRASIWKEKTGADLETEPIGPGRCKASQGKPRETLINNYEIQWQIRDMGRFPFDQKFRKSRVGERMEQTFSEISFRNFGSTSRGWPKIPENRNNRKIPFHSTIPARA